jgi:hypothetical protein
MLKDGEGNTITCPVCHQVVSYATTRSCTPCKSYLCRSCKGQRFRTLPGRRCSKCITRDEQRRKKRRQKGQALGSGGTSLEKQCSKCYKTRGIQEFKLRKNGFTSVCIPCLRSSSKTDKQPILLTETGEKWAFETCIPSTSAMDMIEIHSWSTLKAMACFEPNTLPSYSIRQYDFFYFPVAQLSALANDALVAAIMRSKKWQEERNQEKEGYASDSRVTQCLILQLKKQILTCRCLFIATVEKDGSES